MLLPVNLPAVRINSSFVSWRARGLSFSGKELANHSRFSIDMVCEGARRIPSKAYSRCQYAITDLGNDTSTIAKLSNFPKSEINGRRRRERSLSRPLKPSNQYARRLEGCKKNSLRSSLALCKAETIRSISKWRVISCASIVFNKVSNEKRKCSD